MELFFPLDSTIAPYYVLPSERYPSHAIALKRHMVDKHGTQKSVKAQKNLATARAALASKGPKMVRLLKLGMNPLWRLMH